MAQEWMEAVSSLWESWGPDALVLDQEIPQFVDFTKVKPVNFEGKYFSTRGPLSTIPEPQRRQVFTQAGASGLGCDLATAHADVMLGLVQSPDEMVAFRKDMDRRPESLGRHPATLTAAAHSVRTSRTGVE
jgi:alkanesulfonate monooxygenase SsuD/methylene tetrahydromethanopterin reductase-like flavin-dependent oxidoreductase (luciferase family)